MSRTNVLFALAAGAAMGAIAGVLLAPASGKETRSKLLKNGETLRDQLTDLMKQGKEMAADAKNEVKDAASQAGNKVRETADQAKSPYGASSSDYRSGPTV